MSLRFCAVHHSSALSRYIAVAIQSIENYLNKIVNLQSQPVYSVVNRKVNVMNTLFVVLFPDC